MIDLNAVERWLAFAVTVSALALAGWMLKTNRTQANTNATLVELLDTQLNATEARMSRLEQLQRESIEALLGGGTAAYVEVLQRRADK